MVYFFVALIKHEIRIKCEKCTVSVLYFVVCFAKCEKCLAGPKGNRNTMVISSKSELSTRARLKQFKTPGVLPNAPLVESSEEK